MTATFVPAEKKMMFYVLAAASILIVAGVMTGVTLGQSDRVAFIALAVVGFTMCARSPLGKGALYGWLNPLHILGYLLGLLALALIIAVLANVPLPGLIAAHSAVPALAGLMVVKVLISFLYPRRS